MNPKYLHSEDVSFVRTSEILRAVNLTLLVLAATRRISLPENFRVVNLNSFFAVSQE